MDEQLGIRSFLFLFVIQHTCCHFSHMGCHVLFKESSRSIGRIQDSTANSDIPSIF